MSLATVIIRITVDLDASDEENTERVQDAVEALAPALRAFLPGAENVTTDLDWAE
jgi:hypothetical protein